MAALANKRKRSGATDLAKLQRLQISRKAADTKLRGLRNVVGTGFGLKMSGGVRSRELCLLVFVRRKRPLSRLERKDVIPHEVRRHGRDLPTDVLEIGHFRPELRNGIEDGRHRGTMGCYGQQGSMYYGVSCAHCIGGSDDDPTTPGPVAVEFPVSGNQVLLGLSLTGVKLNGTGVSPDFGVFDMGLVSIANPQVGGYAVNRPILNPYRPPPGADGPQLAALLTNYPLLTGFGATSGLLTGRIAGVQLILPPLYADLLITAPDGQSPLTIPGDSGLLWIGPNGTAMGFHTLGDGEQRGVPSTHTIASFAYRTVDHFRIVLRAP